MNLEFLLFLVAMGAYMVLLKVKQPAPKRKCSAEIPSSCTNFEQTASTEVIVTDVGSQQCTEAAVEVVEQQQVETVQVDATQAGSEGCAATNEAVEVVESHLKNSNFEEVRALLEERSKPDDTELYNLLLDGYVQNGFFKKGLELFDDMAARHVQLNTRSRSLMVKLMSHTRELDHASKFLGVIESSLRLPPKSADEPQLTGSLPPLVAVATRAAGVPDSCTNQIKVTGKLPQVRAACKSLKKHGFLKKCKDDKFQLNGHWVTEHGLSVIIEGKLVRWSQKRASRLTFTSNDKRTCSLGVYGERTQGQLVAPTIPDAIKSLKWDNGDVWHAFDGCRIAHRDVFSQSMTKVLRDDSQDDVVRARFQARLQLVGKCGLGLLPECLEHVLQYLGSDTYFVDVNFDCFGGPAWMGAEKDTDFVSEISLRHPQVGFRHCWAEGSKDVCGQRALVEGKEVDEDSFRCLA